VGHECARGCASVIKGRACNDRIGQIYRGSKKLYTIFGRARSDSRLQADNVKIIHSPAQGGSGFGEVITIEARGNVYYVTPQETVKGDMAVYTASTDTMIISGEVILKQGLNVLTGNRLTIQVGAEKTTMDATPGTSTKGRVRGVFYPKSEKR
jgi:lipopolysaccharide export system protein LptA